ncbi:MAG: restriction endonuclease subunit S, partial [Aphanizomenon sp.]
LETQSTTNQAVCACTCFKGFYNLYLFIVLKAYKNIFSSQGAGGAQPNISREKIIHTIAPLPPLNEQKRIVTKVDELMKLCDELEARQKKKQETRILINNAALNKLLTADTPETFTKNWQRIGDNFDLLYSAPENIGKLRQAILQLAVMGKLVPQNANDEPAAVLLERIKKEKERLIKEGKVRKSKVLPPITLGETLYKIPNNWQWTKLGQCIELVSGQHLNASEQNNHEIGIPYLTGASDFGKVYPKITRWTTQAKAVTIKNDILLSVKGTVGKSNILDLEQAGIGRQIMALRPILINYQYLYLFCLSASEKFYSLGVGIAIPGISRDDVLQFVIPLPPLNEQKRIVTKVDKLMKLCDELETKLTQTQTEREKIINAAVKQLLTV